MSKAKIERLKKKFWNEYTLLWDVYPDAFELMREIGFEQGKLKKGEQLTNHSPQENCSSLKEKSEDVSKVSEDTQKGCGKWYKFNDICDKRCIEGQLCPACSGAGE